MIGRPVGLGEAVVLGVPSIASQPVGSPGAIAVAEPADVVAGPPEYAEAVVGAAEEHDRRGAGGEAPGAELARHTGQATTGWCG